MTASILVVEDEAVIARDIRATLQALGYVAPPAVTSGQQALDAISMRSPDLVLMDVRIHGEMDGIETAARIRDRFGTPVVYLTSHSDEATVTRAKGTGAYGYVLKPFSDRELRIAVEVALQKHEIERRMSERERWFATTLRSIGDAVIATDAQQRITFMNVVAEKLTGFSAEESLGRPLGEVLRLVEPATGAPIESPLSQALRDGFAVELPRGMGLTTKAGDQREVDDSAAPIIDERGETLGGVVVFRDVTERKQLEKRLAQNERLAAIGTLSAGMAHEINNPLGYVLANVSFALESLDEVQQGLALGTGEGAEGLSPRLAQIRDALGEARDGSMRVHRIVHDLKRFGRMDGGERRLVELCDAMESALRLAEHTLRHEVRVRREYRTTPFVVANEGQLAQVFVNLLVNAGQACAQVGPAPHEIVVSTYTDDAGRAVGEVTDSGPGVPPEVQRRIFDPFFTTKPVGQGTGLGLSIAHSIVASLGGELSLSSRRGEGATFRVALPPARAKAEEPVAQVETASSRRARVLVIDDEPSIGRALVRVLQRDNDVFLHSDANEALSRVASGDRFDVVFCDLMMPGVSGMDFFDALSRANPSLATRVVFVTGGAVTPQAQAFLERNSNATLVKPVDPSTLRRIVRDYASRDG